MTTRHDKWATITPANRKRAYRAKNALKHLAGYDPYDPTANVVDMLTDLMHLADLWDCDFDEWTRVATTHWTAETQPDCEDRQPGCQRACNRCDEGAQP
jgi:hypothetical protein